MNNVFNPDFLEFCNCLNDAKVEYILVGGYTVILHGYPRTTGDLDIWVNCNSENYQKLKVAFDRFRLPVFDMTEKVFLNSEKFDVFRFGRPPVAIDILTKVKGLSFKDCFENADFREFEKVLIRYLNYHDLIKAKKASGRPKDINDIDNLRK